MWETFAPWRLTLFLIFDSFPARGFMHKFYFCKYTWMQNQNRWGACDADLGGGCFQSKQSLFLLFLYSVGSQNLAPVKTWSSVIEWDTGKGFMIGSLAQPVFSFEYCYTRSSFYIVMFHFCFLSLPSLSLTLSLSNWPVTGSQKRCNKTVSTAIIHLTLLDC